MSNKFHIIDLSAVYSKMLYLVFAVIFCGAGMVASAFTTSEHAYADDNIQFTMSYYDSREDDGNTALGSDHPAEFDFETKPQGFLT